MRLYKPKNKTGASNNWWFYHAEVDAAGNTQIFRQSTRTSSRDYAEQIAWGIVQDFRERTLLKKRGHETHDDATSQPLIHWVSLFTDHLITRQVSKKQVGQVINRLSITLELTGCQVVSEITAAKLSLAISRLERKPRPGQKTPPKPLTSSTKNKYLKACRQFFNWLVKFDHWHKNPAAQVDALPEKGKRERWALSPEDIAKLCESAPRHRALVYLVASATGLRRRELADLLRTDVHLGDLHPALTVRAAISKNSEQATVPLTPDVVEAWRKFWDEGIAFKEGQMRGRERGWWEQRLKDGLALPPIPTIKTFRLDLERAGIEAPPGHRLDFHALRTAFLTNLQDAGVPVHVTQRLARHSDARLTLKHYSKAPTKTQRDAVEKLAKLREKATKNENKRRRGTA